MTGLPKLSVPHARHPMGRALDEGISHGGTLATGEERYTGSHLHENFYRVSLLILQQERGLMRKYPSFNEAENKKQLSEPHAVNPTISVDSKYGLRGKTRPPTSRAPILIRAPSTGVTRHGQERRPTQTSKAKASVFNFHVEDFVSIFTAFRTSRRGLRVHLYRFSNFASRTSCPSLSLFGLRVEDFVSIFIAFRTSRLGLRVHLYHFSDFASRTWTSRLGLRVHFYRFSDFAFQTSCPSLPLFGLRVPDFVSIFTGFRTSRPSLPLFGLHAGQRPPAARNLAGRPEQEIADFRDFLRKSGRTEPSKRNLEIPLGGRIFANRSSIGTAPENREISAIPTVPATGEAKIETGIPQAALRTLIRSSSRRRCGAQRPEPPLSAARRRPRYHPTNPPLMGFGPLRFHCRSSPAQPSCSKPSPAVSPAQQRPDSAQPEFQRQPASVAPVGLVQPFSPVQPFGPIRPILPTAHQIRRIFFIYRSAPILLKQDPGNLPALDLRVVKWQVATPSHVRPSRVPGKVDTPKPRCMRRAHTCPDETKFGKKVAVLISATPLPVGLSRRRDGSSQTSLEPKQVTENGKQERHLVAAVGKFSVRWDFQQDESIVESRFMHDKFAITNSPEAPLVVAMPMKVSSISLSGKR
ncbi:hypothetical protein CRG98_042420 [Punica granatum]|uniref:Uncharacterized protein n=1 Tax=Punica granatum TaxID=22663 RepID=A0A2I0HZQ0_PUNGR|nr:hypothetical protein CRG98_042420 [Punica granatum]